MKLLNIKLLAIAFFANGCTHYYYAPNKVNIPGLREQGDARLEAGIGKGWLMIGGDVQGSYAVTDNVGIMVNGALTSSVADWGTDDHRTRSSFIEGGIGYFHPIDTEKKWLFEIYGGGGPAKYRLSYESGPPSYLTTNSFFLQPAFVFTKPGRNVEIGIASRLRGVNFLELKTSGSPLYNSSEIYKLLDAPMKGFWEPTFRFSAGGEKVRFYFSYSLSLGLNQSFVSREIMTFNTGIRFNFNAGSTQPVR